MLAKQKSPHESDNLWLTIRRSNQFLSWYIQHLTFMVEEVSRYSDPLPSELQPLYSYLTTKCVELKKKVDLNDKYVECGPNSSEWALSQIREIAPDLFTLDHYCSGCILRLSPANELCLYLINWLHQRHGKISGIPAGLNDGVCSCIIKPMSVPGKSSSAEAAVYLMPGSFQHGLLGLPLLLHELGHALYSEYSTTMDSKVKDLQKTIRGLVPKQYISKHGQNIEDVWPQWIQEFFCDAVALSIGGPCFVNIMSAYFRMQGESHFRLYVDNLGKRSHPVSWIRIKLLAHRARNWGWEAIADNVEKDWEDIASALKKKSKNIGEFYGYWDDTYLEIVQETINKMIELVSPLRINKADIDGNPDSIAILKTKGYPPLVLLNLAWSRFFDNPDNYLAWETNASKEYLELMKSS